MVIGIRKPGRGWWTDKMRAPGNFLCEGNGWLLVLDGDYYSDVAIVKTH